MKKCIKCGELKPLTEYYKHKQMRDGHLNKCKFCAKLDVRKNRLEKIDYYRWYDRERAGHAHRVEARKSYAKTPQGIAAKMKAQKKWESANKKKSKAHNMVNNAVRDGKMIKPNRCQCCGKVKNRINGHHDDYDRPLDVRWLCDYCHRAWHKENGEGLNAQ